MTKAIGNIIKDNRLARRLSQAELANSIKVTPPYISRLESGNCAPSDRLCIEIAKVLKIDEKELRTEGLKARESIDIAELLNHDENSKSRAWSHDEKKLISHFRNLEGHWKEKVIDFAFRAQEYSFLDKQKK
jgi:transcriptional regulator with XRE-family HTH domain